MEQLHSLVVLWNAAPSEDKSTYGKNYSEYEMVKFY
jgi:hypothetical protein